MGDSMRTALGFCATVLFSMPLAWAAPAATTTQPSGVVNEFIANPNTNTPSAPTRAKFASIIAKFRDAAKNAAKDAVYFAENCPKSDAASLTAWRENAIGMFQSNSSLKVSTAFKKCFGNGVPQCLEQLKYFNEAKLRLATGAGSNSLYEEYNNALDKLPGLRSEKDLPPELLAKDAFGKPIPGRVVIPKDIIKIAKEKGWYTTNYKTRSTGGFNEAPNLFILVIPGVKQDIALQIQLPTGGNGYQPHVDLPEGHMVSGQESLTIISVDKTSKPYVGQTRLMEANGGVDGTGQRTYGWTKPSQCYGCHAVPFRPISPVGYENVTGAEIKMTPEHEAEVDKVNSVLLQDGISWGRAEVNGREIRFGVLEDALPIGWAPKDSPTRKEAYVKQCSSGLTDYNYEGFGGFRAQIKYDPSKSVNWKKVSRAMNCVYCHTPEGRRNFVGGRYNGFSRRKSSIQLGRSCFQSSCSPRCSPKRTRTQHK